MFRYVPYIPTSSNTFIIQGFWIVSKGISASNEVSIGYFLSVCLNDRLLIWFSYVESSLHHWEEAYLIMVDDLLIFPWILFVFYCILFHVHRKKLISNSLFYVNHCAPCLSWWLWPHQMNLSMFILFLFWGIILENVSFNSSLKVW